MAKTEPNTAPTATPAGGHDAGGNPPAPAPPPVDPAQFGPSVVRLFGTVFGAASAEAFQPAVSARATRNLLSPDVSDAGKAPKLARIYGFSHEGRYVPLQPPALFLVHGPGVDAPAEGAAGAVAVLGFVQKTETFMPGLKVWAYDLNEVTSRVDHSSGTLQDLLGAPPAGVPGTPPRRTDILSGQEGSFFGRAGRLAI